MKVVIIGGNDGLGLGITKQLIKEGADELITIGRNQFSLNDEVNHTHYTSDVFDFEEFQKTLHKISSSNDIDIIICVAGYAEPVKIEDLEYEDWQKHLHGNFLYVTEAFKILKDSLNKNGSFITIGSKWSFIDQAGPATPYAVAKNALRGYSVSIANSFKDIICNHYAVPTMDTKLLKNAEEKLIIAGEVKEKFSDNSNRICDPSIVGSILVNHILNNKLSGVTYYMNRKLEVIEIKNNANRLLLNIFNEEK